MTKNANDELTTENVICIPKEAEVSDGEDSTMYSSEVEEMGPYYKRTHYPIDFRARDLETNADQNFFEIMTVFTSNFAKEEKGK